MPPSGILFDYGGTLVEETGYDSRAGYAALLSAAAYCPSGVTVERILERARVIAEQLADRRDEFGIETPWPALTRLIFEFFGVRFERATPELELIFWKASVTTVAMMGARDALEEFHRSKVPMALVSNCSFGSHVLRYELNKYGLAEHLAFVMVTADYAVRKPDTLLFETAAARLGVAPQDIWFVGDRLDTDMAGAKAAGMKPVWLSAHGSCDDSCDAAGVYFVARSWPEIVERFRAERANTGKSTA